MISVYYNFYFFHVYSFCRTYVHVQYCSNSFGNINSFLFVRHREFEQVLVLSRELCKHNTMVFYFQVTNRLHCYSCHLYHVYIHQTAGYLLRKPLQSRLLAAIVAQKYDRLGLDLSAHLTSLMLARGHLFRVLFLWYTNCIGSTKCNNFYQLWASVTP